MIPSVKQQQALKAMQDLSNLARTMAYENAPRERLARLLDDLDALFGLVLEEQDRLELFQLYLKEMCDEFDAAYVWTIYSGGVTQA